MKKNETNIDDILKRVRENIIPPKTNETDILKKVIPSLQRIEEKRRLKREIDEAINTPKD